MMIPTEASVSPVNVFVNRMSAVALNSSLFNVSFMLAVTPCKLAAIINATCLKIQLNPDLTRI